MNSTQSKMARAALGWSTHDLAKIAGVARITAVRFEAGSMIAIESLDKLCAAFEAADVRFIGSGVYKGGVCPPGADN